MLKRFYIFLIGVLSGFLPVLAQDMPISDPLAKPVYEALVKGKFAFTPEVKAAWLAYGEATVREKQKSINEKTWAWFKARPAILSAAFSADFPIEPNILVNFQRLARPFEPTKVDRYSQLILAYAIRYRDKPVGIDRLDEDWDPQAFIKGIAKDGDFYLVEKLGIPIPTLSEDHQQLADYLNGPQQLIRKTRKLEITDLMSIPLHEINILTELQIKSFPNWNDLALAGKMYPPYFKYDPTHQQSLAMKIYRHEHHPNKPKPAFLIDKADWPMMLALGDLDPLDETSYLWSYFVREGRLPAIGAGGLPNVLASDPLLQFRRSKFNPKKFIRIYNDNPKDQGGKGHAFGCRTINLPAEAVAAPPGGIFEIHGGPGNYSVKWGCAIGDDESTSPFHLDQMETIEQTRPAKGGIFHYHFKGLALTLSQGREEYEDTRIALAMLKLFPTMAREEKITLLESMFLRNPLNSDLVYNLAWLYKAKSDFDATTRMIAAIRGYYDKVSGANAVTGAVRSRGQAEVKRILRDRFANSKNAPFFKDEWVHRVCHDVIMFCFDDIPSDVDSMQRNRDALAAELAYQKRTGNKKRIEALTELVGYYNQDISRGRKALQAAKERRAKEGTKKP